MIFGKNGKMSGWMYVLAAVAFIFIVSIFITASDSEQLKAAAIQKTYVNGFALIMDGVASSNPKDEKLERLAEVKKYYQYVKWATYDSDGAEIRYIANSNVRFPYVTVMPRKSDWQNMPNVIAEVRTSEYANLLTIKPVKVTKVWAGLTLVHNIIHLLDATIKEPVDDYGKYSLESEVVAINTQILAADFYSKGEFIKKIKEITEQKKLTDSNTALFFMAGSDNLAWASKILDPVLFKGETYSADEKTEREYFYTLSIVFFASEKPEADETENLFLQVKALEQYLSQRNI